MDRPTCLANLPLKSESFMQHPGELLPAYPSRLQRFAYAGLQKISFEAGIFPASILALYLRVLAFLRGNVIVRNRYCCGLCSGLLRNNLASLFHGFRKFI